MNGSRLGGCGGQGRWGVGVVLDQPGSGISLDQFLSGEWVSLPICQGHCEEREHAFLKSPLPASASPQTEAVWIKASEFLVPVLGVWLVS